MAGLLPTLKAFVRADTSDFNKKMRDVQKRMSGTTGAIRAATPALLALSVATLGVGIASVKMATDFDREMTKIVTLVGVADSQVNQWRKSILGLAPAVGRGPRELSKAMFFITSAGQRGAEALKILEQSAKAAAIGLGDTSEVARAVTAAVNAYGVEVLDAKRATEILVATIREGNIEAGELAPVLGRVIGIAQQMGVAFEEVGAFVATFTRLGVSADIAVTSLRGFLTVMLRGGRRAKMMDEALAPVGSSIAKLRKQISERGLTAALIGLFDSLGGNISALGQVIPNVRALSGAMGTAGAQAETFTIILDNIRNSVGILDEAFKRTLETPAQDFATLKAQIEATAIALGNELAPAVTSVVRAMKPMLDGLALAIKGFSSLPEPVKVGVIAIAGLVAVLGPLALILTTIVGPLIGFIGALSGGAGLGVALAGLVGPAGWIALAIVGLGGLAIAFGKAKREAQAFADLQDEVAEILATLDIGPRPLAITGTLTELQEEMRGVRESLKDIGAEAKESLAKDLGGRLKDAARNVGVMIAELEKLKKPFPDVDVGFDLLGKKMAALREKAKEGVRGAIEEYNLLKSTLGTVETSIAGVVDELDETGDAGAEAAKKIQSFLDNLQSSADALADEAAEMRGGVGAMLDLQIAREGLSGQALKDATILRDEIILRSELIDKFRAQEAAAKKLQAELERMHQKNKRFMEQNQEQARRSVQQFVAQLKQAELIAEAQRLESTFRTISESIGDFFTSIATDGENALDALKNSLRGILRAIQDFVTQEFVVKPLFGFLKGLGPTPGAPGPITGIEPPPAVRDIDRLPSPIVEGLSLQPIVRAQREAAREIVTKASVDTAKVTTRQDTQTRLIAALGGNLQNLAAVMAAQRTGIAQGSTALRTGRGAEDFEAFLTRSGVGMRPTADNPLFSAPLRGGRGKGGPGPEIRIPRLEVLQERTTTATEQSARSLGSMAAEISVLGSLPVPAPVIVEPPVVNVEVLQPMAAPVPELDLSPILRQGETTLETLRAIQAGMSGQQVTVPRLEVLAERTSTATEQSAETLGSVDAGVAAVPGATGSALAVVLPAALAPLFASLLQGVFGDSTFGKIAGTVLGIGASIFSGGLASGAIKLFQGGGQFKAGETFIAGEVGPELVRSSTGGNVLSNRDLAKLLAATSSAPSEQPPAVIFNVNATSFDPAFAVELFEREAPALARSFVRATEANRAIRRSFLE